MTAKLNDEGIRAVRDIREKISAECGHDPKRLVDRYLVEQEHYRKRLLQPVAAQSDAADDALRRR